MESPTQPPVSCTTVLGTAALRLREGASQSLIVRARMEILDHVWLRMGSGMGWKGGIQGYALDPPPSLHLVSLSGLRIREGN